MLEIVPQTLFMASIKHILEPDVNIVEVKIYSEVGPLTPLDNKEK
jgi:hypothetical protein